MENTASAQQGAQDRFGIGAKLAALVCAALVGTTAAGLTWGYHHLGQALVGEEFRRQRASLESLTAELDSGVESLRQDIVFVALIPTVVGIVQAREISEGRFAVNNEQRWRGRIADVFEAKLRAEPQYFRIRLIEAASGKELVRVDRRERGVYQVPPDMLETRSGRPYVRETIQLPAGAVYLSEPELNEEDGPGLGEGIPLVRAATPIYDASGRLFGLVVVDNDLRNRFARLRETLAHRNTLYLFKQSGGFLVHPDPSRSLVSPRTAGSSVADEFPAFWPLGPNHEIEQAIVDLPDSGKTVVASCHKLNYDPDHPERYYGLLVTADYDDTMAPATSLRNPAILFGSFLTVSTIATVWVFSRRLTRPVRKITAAVKAFTGGQTDFELPLEAHDEAGVLARAFDGLFHQIRAHDAVMRAEISERRRAEVALRESEQQLQLALAAAKAGVWVWDAAGRASWDSSMEELFGLAAGTFDGTLESWGRLVHADDWPGAEAALRRSLREGQAFRADLRARAPGGGWRDLKLNAMQVSDGSGRPARLIGVCWDISDEKFAQKRIQHYAARLERKNQEMEQFLYSVSHDLKAPLATCKGFLGILVEELRDGNVEQALGAVQRVERGTRQMTRLIDDLLQFSRIGRATNNPEPVEISALARELSEELRQQRGAGDVRIEIQDEMPVILADPIAVSRLFQNLLANAFKYGLGGPEPCIGVGGLVSEEEIRFFVRDNGPGIPKELQHKIFGLFERLDTTQEGTGIGLAIVSKIMELHGGRVWVESDSQQGTAFWLAFPLRFLAPAPSALTRSLA